MRLIWVIFGILVGAVLIGAPGAGQAQPQRGRAAEPLLPLPPPPTPAAPPIRAAPLAQPVPTAPPPPPAVAQRGARVPVVWATIYAAAPPSRAYGISPATGDRLIAHQRAEAQCRAGPGGNTCRRLVEIQQGCAVLVQGARDDRLLPFTTPDPNQPVMLAVAGAGFTLEDATRDGMDQCQRRQRGAICRVIASICAR